MKTHAFVKHLALMAGILTLIFVAGATSPPEKLPWSLREHYTFSNGPLRLDYAVDNAEWRLRLFDEDDAVTRLNPDVVVRDVGFLIELGDGRLLTHDALGLGGETRFEREPGTVEHLGPCVHYTLYFVPQDGIQVRHRLTMLRQWNFFLLTIAIENIGEAPIDITRINSAIFGPGAIAGLTDNATVSKRNATYRGGYPVFSKDGPATKIRFYDPARDVSMAFGLLPTGPAFSSLEIQPGGGAWQGRIESSFAPGITVLPGNTLESTPVWLIFGTAPAVIDAQYAWVLSDMCKQASNRHMPRAWVSIPDTEGLTALRSEAANAMQAGIVHALIPGNWEGRPGSFEGGAPRYPRNIGDAARTLRDVGVAPGITVDPLLGQSGSAAWTAQSIDGQTWVNLSAPGGREFAVNRMRRIVEMGFEFIVIEQSHIPDEVLRNFGMTRAWADNLAFDVAREAVCDTPVSVLPASAGRLGLNRDAWLEAASAVCRQADFRIAAAPLRLQLGNATAIDDETLSALRFWRGPIEFITAPQRAVHNDLAALLRQRPLSVRPQDASNRSPLVWLARVNAPSIGYMGANIISFTGAGPLALADIETFGGEEVPVLIWRPEGGRVTALTDGLISPASRFTTHGLLGNATQPVFAGIAQDITLGLERVRRINWDDERRVLSGQIDGPLAAPAVAFFHVPAPMRPLAARVGTRQVRPEIHGSWLYLPLEPSGGVFELEFAVN